MTKFENESLRTLIVMKKIELEARLKTEEDKTNKEAIARMLEGLKMYETANIFLDLRHE